jgi:integrase
MRPEGHIRQRSPGSYEVRYCVGRDGQGKWRWATFTVKGTKKDARQELRRRLDRPATTGKITVGQWLKLWLETVRQEVSPKTHERYGELVQNFLVPALGSVPLAKLGPLQIQPVYNSWAIGGRLDGKPGGLAPRTRHHLHRILKSALSRAVADQLLLQNPLDRRRWLPKVERQPMAILTPEQSNDLLSDLRHTRMYWPTLLALTTGMRRGEILALRWKNVDLKSGVVRVVQSLGRNPAREGQGDLTVQASQVWASESGDVAELCCRGVKAIEEGTGRGIVGAWSSADRREPGLWPIRWCTDGARELNS